MILLAVGETFRVYSITTEFEICESGVLAVRQGGKHDSRLPERYVFFTYVFVSSRVPTGSYRN